MIRAAFFITLAAVGISLLFAGERTVLARKQKNEIRHRTSHEDIAKKQRPRNPKLKDRIVRLDELQRVNFGDPVALSAADAERRKGLVGRSTIISAGSHWTIVPKDAVLYLPSYYKERVDGVRNGTLLGWQDFYTRNHNWISLQDVTLQQASGEVPLSPETLERYKKIGYLVVAVCRGGPISVKPPKEVPSDPGAEAGKTAEAEEQEEAETKALETLRKRLQQRRD